MKKSLKVGLFLAGFLFISTGCSVNYCNENDIANIKSMYELKTSIFVVDKVIEYADAKDIELTVESEDLYTYVTNTEYSKQVEDYLTTNVNDASTRLKGYMNTEGMNEKVENEYYLNIHKKLTEAKEVDGKTTNDLAKFYPNAKAGLETLTNDKNLKNTGTCLTIDENVKEPGSGANLDVKTWGDAWKEGPLQGLITFPIAFGLISFTNMIGATGVGQILSILIVTIIVRLLITLATFKTTMQQQKMTLLQPELNAIQVKYSGKTDEVSRQKMSQEMMKIYSKYGVNPLKSLIMPFISMPVFLCVYHAVNNTSILKTGTVFGVNLGDAMSTGILQGRWFAIVLFILMVAMQFASMKIPTWMQKYKTKKSGRRPDPRQSDSQKQANMMTNIFFVMIVFMGWMLPTSMTVYWIASSVVSLVQTIVTQTMLGKKSKQELMKK
jgi:YidC/Oxa1 family membrane protein insertase